MSRRVLATCFVALSLVLTLLPAGPAVSHTADAQVFFPVQAVEGMQLTNSYGDSRGSRTHRGVDIMSPQMTELYATESGYIRRAYGGDSRECLDGGYCRSYGLLLYGDDGNSYFYLHLNDDTPGRPSGCDHRGGAENAFSPRLVEILRQRGTLQPVGSDRVWVEKGELIGYNGSSGNAGCRVDHLHFEMWSGHAQLSANDSRKTDPYPHLRAALDAGRYHGPEGAGPDRPDPAPHGRIAGENRIRTAVELSQASFEQAETVVLAPAGVPTEALLAAPLGAVLGGPVLLTWDHQTEDQDVLAQSVADEIKRLGASYAVIVGSTERLDGELEQQLVDRAGLDEDNIRRLGETDRYELSRQVADEVLAYHGMRPPPGSTHATDDGGLLNGFPRTSSTAGESGGAKDGSVSPIVALGEHPDPTREWPDALAATVLAARQAVPILLTRGDELPGATREVLTRQGIGEVRITGGTAAISADVAEDIRDLGHPTRRLAGPTRYHTALDVASEVVSDGASPDRVMVATGHNFPDALAAGQAVASQDKLLVLTNGAANAGIDLVREWMRTHADAVHRLDAIGGPAAVTDAALEDLAVHANWPYE